MTPMTMTAVRPPKTNPGSADTRQRLIDAAAVLFAERGFDNVTVREICKASNANVAAINYHFGDKAGLYRAVVNFAIQLMQETNEQSQRAGDGRSPEDQIRGFVRVFVQRVTGQGPTAWIHKLMAREMEKPTEALDQVMLQVVKPRLEYLCAVVSAIMGLPRLVSAIRKRVGPSPAIVVQHHGGEFPVRAQGWLGAWQRRQWRKGLDAASALSFTAHTQAGAWRDAGVIGSQPIIEIIEASTWLRPSPRSRAQQLAGVTADPLILWVGRLTTNKDPLAVLDGFERALTTLPHAQLVMIFGDDTLRDAVEQRLASSPRLRSTVVLVGRVDHHELAHYYGAADLFVSGSHYEGSGYALIEAMAAGLTPVVTDIPSFRVIAGSCAQYWPVGDPVALGHALTAAAHGNREQQRTATLQQFDTHVSWTAIAARTMTAYETA